MSWLDTLREFIEFGLHDLGVTVPPYSSIFFIFVTLFISLLSHGLNHLLLDMDAMAKESAIMAEHNKNKKLAMEKGDKKLWIRVQRADPKIQELQQKSMFTRLLPMLVTYGPFIFIFTTLRATFQLKENLDLNLYGDSCHGGSGSCGIVSVLPFQVPESIPLIGRWFSPYAMDPALSAAGYGFWYFLTAIVTSTFFLRVLGINLSRNAQPNSQII